MKGTNIKNVVEVTNKLDTIAYWDGFYKSAKKQVESSFCKLLKGYISKDSVILDIGCGSGRDSISFANDGNRVIGIDRSIEAINFNNDLSVKNQLKNIHFKCVDLENQNSFENVVKEVSQSLTVENNLVLYLRFLLHSIDNTTEENLISIISRYIKKGDIFAAEFRTTKDKYKQKVFDNHFRRYIEPQLIIKKFEKEYHTIVFEEGTGLAVYKDEDPHVARMIMKKK